MCNPASFIVTKDKVFWSKKHESHSEIISEFNIHADGIKGANIVKVEVTPANGNFLLPLDEWDFTVDQNDTPKWFDLKTVEERVRLELPKWLESKIILPNQTVNVGSNIIAVYGTVQKVWDGGTVHEVWDGGTVQEVLNGGTVQKVLNGGTVQKVLNGGTVQKVLDGGTVQKVLDGGTVQKVWDGGTVQKVWNGGTVQRVLNGGTVQEVWDGGTVQRVLNGGTVQEVSNGGTVQEVWDGGTVQRVLNGGTVQKVWDGGTVQEVWDGVVTAYCKLPTDILKSKDSVLIDRSGLDAKVFIGRDYIDE